MREDIFIHYNRKDFKIPAKDVTSHETVDSAMARIHKIYKDSIQQIRNDFDKFALRSLDELRPFNPQFYPYLFIEVTQEPMNVDSRQSFGFVRDRGIFGTTLTRPRLYDTYYKEQIKLLLKHNTDKVFVGISGSEIPVHFALPTDHNAENSNFKNVSREKLENLSQFFTVPHLKKIDDSIPNGTISPDEDQPQTLSIFSAERVDVSLQRLKHYTGTSPEHFQKFVLFTNYQFYVEEFIKYAKDKVFEKSNISDFTTFVEPGDLEMVGSDKSSQRPKKKKLKFQPQMPAYHLKRKDGLGITLINIGVGPSNAKTITDHVAVLRPHCWLMLGHCAGLRRSQKLGDYVLAHGYVREDKVLDHELPLWVPVPPLAEIQQALQKGVEDITGAQGYKLKSIMRTGTVTTLANRNWEFDGFDTVMRTLSQSRSIAVDMESATIAANGLRFRVPYGTLLCVSDKPLHGELKLPGMANNFYRLRVKQHLKIGLKCFDILREQSLKQLHSRKLRALSEPAFQ